MALSQKLMEGNLILVNWWDGLETYKTKVLVKVWRNWGILVESMVVRLILWTMSTRGMKMRRKTW